MSVKNMSFEELCQKMESEGWTRKDFKNSQHYRGWYYRNRKKVERSGAWIIDHPLTFWYRPLNSQFKENGEVQSLEETTKRDK